MQNRYSLFDRASEPRLGGLRGAGDRVHPLVSPLLPESCFPVHRAAAAVADAHAAKPAQVALAWLLRAIARMLPIPGTSSIAHLEENVAATSLELTDAEFSELSRSAGAVL